MPGAPRAGEGQFGELRRLSERLLRGLPFEIALGAMLYFSVARLALLFSFEKTHASPFWPPAGLALAGAILFGRSAFVGTLIGAFLANLVTFLGDGMGLSATTLASSLGMGLGNAGGALVGWWLLGRPRAAAGVQLGLATSLRLAVAAVGAGLFAALVGATIVVLTGSAPLAAWRFIVFVWASGDALGVVFVLPLVLSWWCADARRGTVWGEIAVVGGQIAVCALATLTQSPVVALLIAVVPWVGFPLRSRRGAWTAAGLGLAFVIFHSIRTGYGDAAAEFAALGRLQLFALVSLVGMLIGDGLLGGTLREDPDGLILLRGRQLSVGMMAPALAITAVGVGISLSAWWSLFQDQQRSLQQASELRAENLRHHLEARLLDLVRAVRRMADRWSDDGAQRTERTWRRDAARYIKDFGVVHAFEWVDHDGVVRWVEPEAPNAAVVGTRPNTDPARRAAMARSTETGVPYVSPILSLKQGGHGFIVFAPVRRDGAPDGHLVVVLRLDAFLRDLQLVTQAWRDDEYRFELLQGGEVVGATDDVREPADSGAGVAQLAAFGKPLEIRATPRPGQRKLKSLVPGLVLNAGLLLSTLLGVSVGLAAVALANARAARAATRAKARFLATMSHEIRTPMNGILGAVELARARPLDAEAADYLALVEQSGQTLLALLNDVLDFSKIEAGAVSLERIPVDVRELLEEMVGLARSAARDKGLNVELQVNARVPERLLADPTRLRQLLSNLLSNAVKFTASGAVRLSVEPLGETPGAPWLRFVCSDTGIGMDEQALSRLFQPFSQADASTTRRYGGTGLGLAIVGELASMMGGTIAVQSEPGVGSTFTLELPFEVAPARLPALDSSPAPSGRPSGTGLSVLVAEDNPINQRIISALLGKLGCAVTVAPNGKVAAELALAQPFDLLLMDMEMPELDGVGATRLIREQETGHRIPIFAVTANATPDDEQACLAAGMTGFLKKPVSGAGLEALLNAQFPRHLAKLQGAKRGSA